MKTTLVLTMTSRNEILGIVTDAVVCCTHNELEAFTSGDLDCGFLVNLLYHKKEDVDLPVRVKNSMLS